MSSQDQQAQGQGQAPTPAGSGGADPMKQQVSPSDLAALMQAQGLPASAQSQIMTAVMGSQAPPAGSTVDMASVLAKIQALEREKSDLKARLDTTSSALTKYREEKSVGMTDKYVKEMKDFIDGLQLKDPEVKQSMHEKMEALAKQGNETGVWEILACASSNHRANVTQIETLSQELNSYREKERQLQGGLFQAESSRISAGEKRASPEGGFDAGLGAAAAADAGGSGDPSNIWGDFHDMVMRQGGNRGTDYSQVAQRFDPSTLR